ncbi:hypothetical protein NPL4_01235 [Metamycoplasma hyosynoviae]|nr:hypothetical protein NPL4_01235 [Metamycoplasma hyosynoviae]
MYFSFSVKSEDLTSFKTSDNLILKPVSFNSKAVWSLLFSIGVIFTVASPVLSLELTNSTSYFTLPDLEPNLMILWHSEAKIVDLSFVKSSFASFL